MKIESSEHDRKIARTESRSAPKPPPKGARTALSARFIRTTLRKTLAKMRDSRLPQYRSRRDSSSIRSLRSLRLKNPLLFPFRAAREVRRSLPRRRSPRVLPFRTVAVPRLIRALRLFRVSNPQSAIRIPQSTVPGFPPGRLRKAAEGCGR